MVSQWLTRLKLDRVRMIQLQYKGLSGCLVEDDLSV
jgi:hypothetical protein